MAFHSIFSVIDKAVNVVIVLFFSIMAGAVFLEVIFRYLVHQPLYWSEELPRIMLIWLTFLGAGLAIQKSSHLNITLLTNRLNRRGQLLLGVIINLVTLSFLLVLLLGGIEITGLTMPNTTAALQIPTGLIYLAVPVGATLMILHLLRQTVQLIVDISRFSAREEKR